MSVSQRRAPQDQLQRTQVAGSHECWHWPGWGSPTGPTGMTGSEGKGAVAHGERDYRHTRHAGTRERSEPGRWPAARTAPSSSASPAATSTAQGSRVGGLPPSCRATPHPRHPASGSQLRGCAKPYQNWHGSRAAREPRRSLQRLQRQRAYAHATKQLTRGVSSINRTH